MSDLVVVFEGVESIFIDDSAVADNINRLSLDYGVMFGDVSLVFCSDSYILDVNKTYLDHDYLTDIITFDYSENGLLSGDLIISLDTVRSNSEFYGVSFFEEIHRVLIHGLLHLCGLNDKSDQDIKMMRERENQYLAICQNPFVSRETS